MHTDKKNIAIAGLVLLAAFLFVVVINMSIYVYKIGQNKKIYDALNEQHDFVDEMAVPSVVYEHRLDKNGDVYFDPATGSNYTGLVVNVLPGYGMSSSRFFCVNGIKNGLSESFFESGYLKMRIHYVNGAISGSSELYYDYSTNLFSTKNYLNGVESGPFKGYHKNGNIFVEMFFVNGVENGEYNVYHDNGIKSMSSGYFNGMLSGYTEHYNRNGAVTAKGYKSNGNNIGLWKYYDEDTGKKFAEKNFRDDGVLTDTFLYDANGNVRAGF